MLTATYNIPASEWTRAIDAALVTLSGYVPGVTAEFQIKIYFDDKMYHVASAMSQGAVRLGRIKGQEVYLPQCVAKLWGVTPVGSDIGIIINRTYPWHHGNAPPYYAYDAQTVMLHELGHPFFSLQHGGPGGSTASPYELWREKRPPYLFADTDHFHGDSHLMSVILPKGKRRGLSELELELAAWCGLPTTRPNRIWLFDGAIANGKSSDTAVWVGPFDKFNAQVVGPSTLEMPGDNALAQWQVDIYRLYRAAFGRKPDFTGFRYWCKSGKTFDQMAVLFTQSPEFQTLYAAAGHNAYVAKLYQNVLGRPGEAAGLAYWNSRADLNQVQLLNHFALSAENQVGVPVFSLP